MQLKPEALDAHLAQARQSGALRAVYTVSGDEPLLAQEALDALRAAARALGYGERQVFTVANAAQFDWSAVLAQAASQSLFAERQLIELRIPGGKPGKEGSEALQRLVDALHPDLLVLLQLPRLDKMQMDSAWYRALDSAGVTLRVEPIERRALPQWLARRAAQQGLKLAEGEPGQLALARLVERVEGNLLAAQQEIDKLALLLPAGQALDLETVETAVADVARFEAGQLCAALWAADLPRCLRLLDALQAEGEAVVRLHWLLADDVRALRRAAQALAGGAPLPMAMREARVWGPRASMLERVLPRLRPAQLDTWLHELQLLEGICKGLREPGWPDEPWAAMRVWVLRVVGGLSGRGLGLG